HSLGEKVAITPDGLEARRPERSRACVSGARGGHPPATDDNPNRSRLTLSSAISRPRRRCHFCCADEMIEYNCFCCSARVGNWHMTYMANCPLSDYSCRAVGAATRLTHTRTGVAVHARGNQGQLGPGRRLSADRSVPVAHPTFGKDFSANC